jgi:hypothetical protein
MGFIIGFLLALFMLTAPKREPVVTAPHREPPSYCIDPWASTDMGNYVYTPCSLVPRRYKA